MLLLLLTLDLDLHRKLLRQSCKIPCWKNLQMIHCIFCNYNYIRCTHFLNHMFHNQMDNLIQDVIKKTSSFYWHNNRQNPWLLPHNMFQNDHSLSHKFDISFGPLFQNSDDHRRLKLLKSGCSQCINQYRYPFVDNCCLHIVHHKLNQCYQFPYLIIMAYLELSAGLGRFEYNLSCDSDI